MAGIESIPYRIPTEWDSVWFANFIRDVLSRSDVRNASGGTGVTISGGPADFGTITVSSTTLLPQEFLVLSASSALDNERVLQGTAGEISLTDGGTTATLALVNTAVTAASYGSATQVATFTVDANGRLTTAADTDIQITEAQVTSLTADLAAKASATLTLTAGNGLSGGGDLSANRSFAVDLTYSFSWTGAHDFSLPPVVPAYAVASLPSASTYARGLIYVSDESGGATIAFSDGTNWRRVQDRAVVS